MMACRVRFTDKKQQQHTPNSIPTLHQPTSPGYAESGTSTFPSIGITGRLAGATLGSMTYDPLIAAAGAGSLTCTCARFGDYASMQVRWWGAESL